MAVRRLYHFILLLTVSQIILFTGLSAQNSRETGYIIKHFTSKNGLAQESVSQLMIDYDGYLWLVNNSGVQRYDGHSFKSFFPDGKRIKCLLRGMKGDSVYVLLENDNTHFVKSGRLLRAYHMHYNTNFVITWRRELVELPRNFVTVLRDIDTSLDARAGDNSHFVCSDGSLYLHTPRTPFAVFATENKVTRIPVEKPEADLRFLLRDTFYVLHKAGYFSRFFKGKRLSNEPHVNKDILAIVENFFDISKWGSIFNEYVYSDNKRAFLYYDNAICELRHDQNGFRLHRLVKNLPDLKDISSIVYYRPSNSFFVSSTSGGVWQIKPRLFYTKKAQTGALNENNMMAIMPGVNDSILSGRGVIYTKDNIVKSNYDIDPYALYKDSKQRYYHASKGDSDGVYRILYRSKSLKEQGKLISNRIRIWATCFSENKLGDVYVSDYKFLYKIQDDSLYKVLSMPEKQESIINCFAFSSDDLIIIGTTDNLLQYSLKNKKIDTLIRRTAIRSVKIDPAGYIWVGTYGKGYYIISPSRKITEMPVDRESRLLFTHNFIFDQKGYVWSATNDGLFRYKVNNAYAYLKDSSVGMKYYRFDATNDGLDGNEFNGGCQPSVFMRNNGSVFMSSMTGIVSFNPAEVVIPDDSVGFKIDAVIADQKNYDPDSMLVFPAGTALIRFSVSSPALGIENNQIYEYQIKGMSTIWNTVDPSGDIIFNGIGSGEHTIVLRKRAEDKYIYTDIRFYVTPPFHETFYFKLLIALVVLILFYSIYKIRINRLEKSKRELEKIVNEKTASLKESLETITESKKKLELSYSTIEKVTGIVLHDLRSPLRFLSMVAGSLITDRKKMDEKDLDTTIKSLYSTSINVFQFTNSLLGWLIHNSKEMKVAKEKVNIKTLLKEIADVYQTVIEVNGNRFSMELPAENVYVNTNSNLLSIIIRNALDNANKYTYNGQIQLIFQQIDSSNVKVSVIDNGKGFDVNLLKKAQSDSKDELSKGLGMVIIDELSQKMDITYSYNSEEGKGTEFMLFLPVEL